MRRINLSTSLLAGLAAITMAGPASAQSTLHSTIEEYKILGGDGSHWVRGTTVENHSVKYGGGEIDRYLNPNDPRFGRDRPEENAQTNVEHPAIIQIEAGPHAGKLVLCALGSANGTPTDVDGDGIYERDGLQDLEDANYVVTTYDRTQLYGAVLTITPTGVVMEKGVYLTDSDGNRYRNAHKCRMSLVNGGRDVLMQHNYAPNNDDNNNGLTCQANHACAYSTVYDGNLVPKSDPRIEEGAIGTLTVAKNNDNCSENDGPAAVAYDTCDCDPETDPDCDPSGTCVTASVQGDGCNGNGRDDSWLTQVRVTCDNSVTEGYPCTIQNYADLSACEDHERWRGQCEKDEGLSSEMGVPVVMCCGTAGNTQPPNKGVRCQGMVVVDTDGMQQVNRNGNRGFDAVYDPLNPAAGGLQLYDDSDYEYNGLYVAENYRDEEGKRVYNTEIKCDPTSAGQFMCRWQKGYPRGGNRAKGSYRGDFGVVEFTPETINVVAQPQTIDSTADITHGRLACLDWGTTGTEDVRCGHITGSILGSSGAAGNITMMRWDETTRTIHEMAQYALPTIEMGHLNNLYGNNPNTQGREMVEYDEIDNPNYGVEGAWMSDVKSFLVIAATGRVLRDEPEPGTDIRINEDKLSLFVSFIPAVIDGEDPDDNTDDVNPDGNGDGSGDGSGNNSGGVAGCSVSSNGTSGGLLGLAFALFFVIRRRRD